MTGGMGSRSGHIGAPLLLVLGSLFLFVLMKAGHMNMPQSKTHHYLLTRVAPIQHDIDRYYERHGSLPGPGELDLTGSEVSMEAGGGLRVKLDHLHPEMKDVHLLFAPRTTASGVSWFCRIEASHHFDPKDFLPENVRNNQAWNPKDGPSMWDTFGLFIFIPIWGMAMSILVLWDTLRAT